MAYLAAAILIGGSVAIVAFMFGYHAGRKEGWYIGLRGHRLPDDYEWLREVLR